MQKLPLEYASVYIRGRKQTSDPRKDLKQQIGEQAAREFYTSREKSKGGMDEPTFSSIAWDDIDAAMRGTSKMYRLWYAKQGSGYCGVGHWTSRYQKGTDGRCPSCYHLDETADHLNRCKHAARTSIFEEQVDLIEQWMESTYMDQDLKVWLLIYLRGRGRTRFQDLPGLPDKLKGIAKEQDDIGWGRFTEGRVSKRIRNMQTAYMINGDSTYTEDHWMRDLIKHLLNLSHEQWLARNLMKHHQTKGAITLETR